MAHHQVVERGNVFYMDTRILNKQSQTADIV